MTDFFFFLMKKTNIPLQLLCCLYTPPSLVQALVVKRKLFRGDLNSPDLPAQGLTLILQLHFAQSKAVQTVQCLLYHAAVGLRKSQAYGTPLIMISSLRPVWATERPCVKTRAKSGSMRIRKLSSSMFQVCDHISRNPKQKKELKRKATSINVRAR